MKLEKLFLLFVCSCFMLTAYAIQPPLSGFNYGNQPAPSGDEWESPEKLSLNKEYPRARFSSFQNVEAARKVLPEHSTFWQSLDGFWHFHWSPTPDQRPFDFYNVDYNVDDWDTIPVPSNWNVYGIQKNGALKYGVPIYVNPAVIFQYDVAVDDWKGGVMRTPPSSWTTYEHRNEVGSYRREFQIPADWTGREVFINFDGVDSFFYLWINGHYVGFSKNSRNAACFNITNYLNNGNNHVAVEVYRNSDGSFLEAQDMFRLPGIFRTVSIYSTPKVQIRDMKVIPDLDAKYTNGSLTIKADVRNLDKKSVKGHSILYTLYANKLYSNENILVESVSATSKISELKSQTNVSAEEVILFIKNPNKWSADLPYRYTLVAELKDNNNKTIETVSAIVGFRKVEIRDTTAEEDEFGLAGRYLYINGETVKLKGVNRHETSPEVGHAITREWMEKEIMIMKRGNINHVRNSHYPTDPYWYYLCDKYGIYLEDEANIESHQYFYGEASLSHPKEWEAAHVARVMEMIHSHKNFPSIVIWSLGNEAGSGNNFVAAYNELKRVDSTRPVQYERNNNIVDMGSNQYPSVDWTRHAATGEANIKYPFHLSEYAHSMGNAVGNLVDYWDAIESSNFLCGGAIWDWIDQAIYNYDPVTGERYEGYGGDFGDKPNDGQFVMNGIIFADQTPKPQYYEVKKVYQYLSVKLIDAKSGKFKLFNKRYFRDLSDYCMGWRLFENGKEIQAGFLNTPNTPARTSTDLDIPYDYSAFAADKEYFIKFEFRLNTDMPWAEKDFVQADEQILLKKIELQPSPINSLLADDKKITVKQDNQENITTIFGDGFKIQFDRNIGSIYSLNYQGKEIIQPGHGPKLDAYHAFINNDSWYSNGWFQNGLYDLQHKVISSSDFKRQDGAYVLLFTVESQGPNIARMIGGNDTGSYKIEETDMPCDFKFTTNQVWTVYSDGSIEFQAAIASSLPTLVIPRLGYSMQLPEKYSNFTYYGRGPWGNYPDRKTGQFIEIHKSTVDDQFEPYPKPQEMANHEEVRWAALTDQYEKGAIFIGVEPMSVQALAYSAQELFEASHLYQLPEPKFTHLFIGLGVTGVGGNSCGPTPFKRDRLTAKFHQFGFIIRPVESSSFIELSNISQAGVQPIMIDRNDKGEISISSEENSVIEYSINSVKKSQRYLDSFSLPEGGTVKAWLKANPNIRSQNSFEKMEYVTAQIAYSSSEEFNTGGDADNLIDGNPQTFWHTTFWVTVAKHPHWVDFDILEEKSIRGITYLPRQDGDTTGNVKDYSIQVSSNGNYWGEVVASGSFDQGSELKTVEFSKPVKGRYVRFTALSEQNGQDYASGAEIGILTD